MEQTGIIREGVTELLQLPNTSGNLESVLAGTALQYVLPNYLTSRTANVRFRMEF